MSKIFRPRNLLILFALGVVIGIVMSKRNAAPPPSYPDPWATADTGGSADGEVGVNASEAAGATN